MELIKIVVFACAFVVGVDFAILGSVKLRLAKMLDIDDAKVGSLISALMFSSMVGVLVTGPIMDNVGYMPVASIGFALAGISLWILAFAPSYKAAFIACVLLGLGTACVSVTGAALAPKVLFEGKASAAQNLFNVFFGLGAFLTPLGAAQLLDRIGYKATVSAIGTVCLIPVLGALASQYPEATAEYNVSTLVGLIGNSAIWVAGAALFCYCGLEATMGGFITTYLRDLDFSESNAGTVLSGFWISLMIARILAAVGLSRVPALSAPTVLGLAVLTIVAIAIMIMTESKALGCIGAILVGLAFGPIFPTLVGVAFTKTAASARDIGGSVYGLIFALGMLGSTIIPLVVGRYSAKVSIRKSLKITLVVAAALTLFSLVLWQAVPAISAGA